MASLNTAARELVLKVVYYGPGLCGKTTSLQALHDQAPPERRGKLVSLATPVDRTLYFDFMPLRVASVRGHPVRLQLFTVPGQVYFNATRKLLLTGADGDNTPTPTPVPTPSPTPGSATRWPRSSGCARTPRPSAATRSA